MAQVPATDPASVWAGIEGASVAESQAVWSRILARGDELAPSALTDFARQSLQSRRARAELLVLHGSIDLFPAVERLAEDPDAEVRFALVRYLEQPRHREVALRKRVALLGRLARGDGEPQVRGRAIEALGQLDTEVAVEELASLVDDLPPLAAAQAVAAMPLSLRALPYLRRWVVGGFRTGLPRGRTSDAVLAAALPLHGRLVADRPGARIDPEERATWIQGLRHPSSTVRAAAGLAFQNFVGRLRAVGEVSRALDALADLERQGLDTRLTHYHRARLAFYPAGNPELARESARAMRAVRGRSTVSNPEERLWLSRSFYLEAMAGLASAPGRAGQRAVEASLDEAEQVLDALIGERLDRADEDAVAVDGSALEFRALLEIARMIVELRRGVAPDDPALVQRARRAHTWMLGSQLDFTRVAGDAMLGWDAILDSELSPFRLLFTNIELPGLAITESLQHQQQLGVLLASVAPREMPGFAPLEGLPAETADPLADHGRRELLIKIQDARLDWIIDEIRSVTRRLVEGQQRMPWVVQVEETSRLEDLDLRRRRIARSFMEIERSGGTELLDLRTPASLALWLSRDLRNEGRAEEARAAAVRMRDDLEGNGISGWWYYFGLELLAQAEIAIGSSYTDEGVPKMAEIELLRAIERLEGIERRMQEVGAGPAQLAPIQAVRCSALVSLAVNANVKLKQPERALEFFERAFELRQDDFMRVLLACYRARSGRSDEARALLRDIRPYPSMYYNMACTYALLGEAPRALELLKRDFDENHPSERSLRRQLDWAAEDPDLESLRGDPGFELLIHPE